ncbi:hypothetical protein M2168_006351 [Streptomyces sp. CZ24]|nr:hypothetical protein [Streptomyces sp. CZ24]
MALLITPGQWGDAPQMIEVLDRIRVPRPLVGRPRTRPGHVSGDKAYSSRRNRRYLRRRRIKHTIPEPRNQRANRRRRGSAGGRPAGFDRERYRRAQRGRTDHQPTQELPRGRHPLRQAGLRLPRHGHRSGSPLMAAPMIRRTVPSSRDRGCPDGSDAVIGPATPSHTKIITSGSAEDPQPSIHNGRALWGTRAPEQHIRCSARALPAPPECFPDVICERCLIADRPRSDASRAVRVVAGVPLRLLDDQTPVRSSRDVNDCTPVVDQPHVQRPRRAIAAIHMLRSRRPPRAGVPQDLAQPPHPHEADTRSTSQTPPADSTASRSPNSRPHSGTALSWRPSWAPGLIPLASVSATRNGGPAADQAHLPQRNELRSRPVHGGAGRRFTAIQEATPRQHHLRSPLLPAGQCHNRPTSSELADACGSACTGTPSRTERSRRAELRESGNMPPRVGAKTGS